MPRSSYTPAHIKGRLATAKRRGWVKTLSKKQNNRCIWCQKPLNGDATLEHMIPLSRGGEDTIQNAAVAHARCNNQKGDMTPKEYRAFLKGQS